MSEIFQEVVDHNNLWHNEGKRGVENLCRLARMLGYEDQTYFGQFSQEASYGDLIVMLEDNPGLVEKIKDWLEEAAENNQEWEESLESYCPALDDEE